MQPRRYALTIIRALAASAIILACRTEADAQIIGFYPAADSITVDIGEALGPNLLARVTETPAGIDTIAILAGGYTRMYIGNSSGQMIGRCLFAVLDTNNQNKYRLLLKAISPHPDSVKAVPFDTAFYLFPWMQDITLIVRVGDLDVDSARVRFHTIATGIEENPDPLMPNATRLLPGYPNPFNPSTTISYTLARDSNVDLIVFNPLGQIVTTLVHQHQPRGTYSVEFSAGRLPSSTFFCRLRADGVAATSRLLLVR